MSRLEILTPRLLLRPPVLEDAAALQSAKAEVWPELQKWMSWAYDDQYPVEATEDFIRTSLETSPHETLLGFCRETGDLVVSTGAHEAGHLVYATGYWITKKYLGRGYATEATNAVIRYAFGALKAEEVTINYYEGNEKSANVIRKLGFTPAGTVREGHKRCSDGTPLDIHLFRRMNMDGLPPLEVSW